ncbi:hypothetical protein DIPPA_33251 [Diplonema papillatum]|nr:hypothetical protein DIPPA_33251 [Diplonema papillatum]
MDRCSREGARTIDWAENRRLAESSIGDESTDPVYFNRRCEYDEYVSKILGATPQTHAEQRALYYDEIVAQLPPPRHAAGGVGSLRNTVTMTGFKRLTDRRPSAAARPGSIKECHQRLAAAVRHARAAHRRVVDMNIRAAVATAPPRKKAPLPPLKRGAAASSGVQPAEKLPPPPALGVSCSTVETAAEGPCGPTHYDKGCELLLSLVQRDAAVRRAVEMIELPEDLTSSLTALETLVNTVSPPPAVYQDTGGEIDGAATLSCLPAAAVRAASPRPKRSPYAQSEPTGTPPLLPLLHEHADEMEERPERDRRHRDSDRPHEAEPEHQNLQQQQQQPGPWRASSFRRIRKQGPKGAPHAGAGTAAVACALVCAVEAACEAWPPSRPPTTDSALADVAGAAAADADAAAAAQPAAGQQQQQQQQHHHHHHQHQEQQQHQQHQEQQHQEHQHQHPHQHQHQQQHQQQHQHQHQQQHQVQQQHQRLQLPQDAGEASTAGTTPPPSPVHAPENRLLLLLGRDPSGVDLTENAVLDWLHGFVTLLGHKAIPLEPRALLTQIDYPGLTGRQLRSRMKVATRRRPDLYPKLTVDHNFRMIPSNESNVSFFGLLSCLFPTSQLHRMVRRTAVKSEKEAKRSRLEAESQKLSPDSLAEIKEIFSLRSRARRDGPAVLQRQGFRELVSPVSMSLDDVDKVFHAFSRGGVVTLPQFADLMKSCYPPYNKEGTDLDIRTAAKELKDRIATLSKQLKATPVHRVALGPILDSLDNPRRNRRIGKLKDMTEQIVKSSPLLDATK